VTDPFTPTVFDAQARATVRLNDGRLATLRWWPAETVKDRPRRPHDRIGPHRSQGAKAKVELPSGAVITVDPAAVTLWYEP
jgi:hypothetical protein